MNQEIKQLPVIKLVGITARTSNSLEMNLETSQIGAMMQKFFIEGVQNKIANRIQPGRVFAVYTNYESDEHGKYTYFLGEEVSAFEENNKELENLTIPAQTYIKFTSNPGPMPAVCINMWQNIWQMKAADLGGERTYIADFEVYDHRSHDPNSAVLDIYIGIKQ